MEIMLNRRDFVKSAAAVALLNSRCASVLSEPAVTVNDIHSGLNETLVDGVSRPRSVGDLQKEIRAAIRQRKGIAISGGRHAMGGQQFASGEHLIDIRQFHRLLSLDRERGLVTVESGIEWPELIEGLVRIQHGEERSWGIRQKQTGADRLTIGGSLAANVHGRGLRMKPFVDDVEAFTLIDPSGNVQRCSRDENRELFSLAIGGYGLFGIIAEVTLRLMPRVKVQRVVELESVENIMSRFDQRIAEGYLFGDFQFAIDRDSEEFLRRGVFSCYRPVSDDQKITATQAELSAEDWSSLFILAHRDKKEAFNRYAAYYLATSGQVYWSDTHQLATYLDEYHRRIDSALGQQSRGSEMISEIYVPRHQLAGFFEDVRADFRKQSVDLIYGTVRLIEKDEESFLRWAREPYACIIFNLHTAHTEVAKQTTAGHFRRLIDLAISRGGSYYLTYHRWARRDQVEACYPQFAQFLERKMQWDPEERFTSDWYRHYRNMFQS